jgi:glycosyltransferase involved in cell wall biosynthesis
LIVTRLAILASHPVQYYAPLFRELARHIDLHVFYAHNATAEQQAAAGFGQAFTWDVDLTSGYAHSFLRNVAQPPGTDRFAGCDTPEIGAHLRQGRFSAVLALGWHLKSMLQGIVAAKRLGLPVLVRGDSQLGTPRGRIKIALKSFAYPRLLRLFDVALFVGRRNRDYYLHYGYPPERLFHSPHCVDTVRFAAAATSGAREGLRARLGMAADDKVVLFAGKLLPFKRPVDVVEAVAGLRGAGLSASVMVAGSGELQADMQERAQALNFGCHVLGFQNQSEMPACYAAADALALPSTARETWGLVCNEALACGTPIVVSDQVGCAPDLAADNDVGRCYPMGDVPALASALGAALQRPPSPAAIKAVSERHSLRAAADGVMASVEFALRRKGRVQG